MDIGLTSVVWSRLHFALVLAAAAEYDNVSSGGNFFLLNVMTPYVREEAN